MKIPFIYQTGCCLTSKTQKKKKKFGISNQNTESRMRLGCHAFQKRGAQESVCVCVHFVMELMLHLTPHAILPAPGSPDNELMAM